MRRAITAAMAVALFSPLTAPDKVAAQDCGDALNRVAKSKMDELLAAERAKGTLCEVARAGPIRIDKIGRLSLNRLKVCLSQAEVTVDGAIDLTCKTSDAATIKSSISEKINFSFGVRTSDCGIQNFDTSPSGELGKLIAGALNLRGKAEELIAASLRSACK